MVDVGGDGRKLGTLTHGHRAIAVENQRKYG